jgi:excinuclease ABC subunit A
VRDREIQLRGVEVHNLKSVDLDLPHRQLIVFCGRSGSGKTSLALDTLYAEGQRRYIESFSAYTRQFLDRLEKPAAERIDGLPPAIAVTHKNASRSSRSTVGTTTETADYLRLLFAKIGRTYCPVCQHEVRRDSPESAAARIVALPAEARVMLTFLREGTKETAEALAAELMEDGYVRVLVDGKTISFAGQPQLLVAALQASVSDDVQVQVIADRLTSTTNVERVRDSLETALNKGNGQCFALVNQAIDGAKESIIDEQPWWRIGFSRALRCSTCERVFPQPEPRLFSFNSPLGACPTCEGFGNVIDIDMELVAPDPGKSLREGAIAPWNTPAYAHELEELLALAPDYGIPTDVPFRDLKPEHLQLIREGVPERNFGGLRGFFAWLERHKYKMHLRVYLSRWRTYRECPTCHGSRLKAEALNVRVGEKNIAEISAMKVADATAYFRQLELTPHERTIARVMLDQVVARISYLEQVGLRYLTLDRTLRTLSGGEAQRVALTSALGSNLVNMLYVLDEPSIGLHPHDVEQLKEAIVSLKRRGNTVVLVEHEESMIRAADQLVEVGPGAGERGGKIVFQGTLDQMLHAPHSLTGEFLSARRGISVPAERRPATHGKVRLKGARGNNLKNLTVEFPLGVLCLVTGVSGSGKSTLVQDTLYGALCRRKRKEADKPYPYDDVYGDGQIDDVVLVDQSPIGRSPRSNPVTYIKAFDEIRQVFADTVEARTHNYSAGHFSFNVEGGRCETCEGDGYLEIDMQFLADVYMKCSACHGTRYRKEILQVTYRNKNIAEVLEMTVREAFSFFRGQTKCQAKLKRLIDVGLDYLRLGQPANTLSAGEAQRLKLAGYLSSAMRNRTLFILDEPTTGLHFADIVQLLDCFEALLNVGHSLIIVEHNVQLMKAADYIIDLGPGAGEYGGQVVAQGTPEEVAQNPASLTGQVLAEALAKAAAAREEFDAIAETETAEDEAPAAELEP